MPLNPKLKKALLILGAAAVVIGIGIQFVPVEGIGANPDERFEVQAPPEVMAILRESCFDCHSNETRWPWYARLAPGSWLMVRDVRKGRARFNFSEWGDYDAEDMAIDKESAWEEIEEGEMPPWFYLPLHPSARLDDQKKVVLKEWLLAQAETEPSGAAPEETEAEPEKAEGEPAAAEEGASPGDAP